MARAYRVTPFVRVSNAIMSALLRRGVKVGSNVLLTVPGRKSGEPRTIPVTLIERDGARYLQSPFGEVNWVRNLRAARHGTLRRGKGEEAIAVVEVSPAEAARVYQAVLGSAPALIRGYFNVKPDSPLEEFEREAPRHPMFRIMGEG